MQNLKEKFAPVENRTPVVHPVGSNLPHRIKYLEMSNLPHRIKYHEIIPVVWIMKSRDGERTVRHKRPTQLADHTVFGTI